MDGDSRPDERGAGTESHSTATPTARIDAAAERVGRFRWVICALLFAATALNYVDRQIIGILEPMLAHKFHWTETDYSNVVFSFQLAYAIGYLIFGKLIDRIGARVGYALAVAIWTVAHVAHAWASSLTDFIVARFAIGLGESGNFPAGLKAVAEWFPKRERALATGIFNAGTNIGAIVTPLIVPVITLSLGWQAAFLITGSFTLIWLVVWLAVYRPPRQHKRLGTAELALIESDPPDPAVASIPWRKLLAVRETWAYALGKFLIDPVWWMWLFWLPDFLVKRHHLDLKTFGPPLVVIYVISDVGSIAGGWMSSRLLRAGCSLNTARKSAMLLCAVLVLPVFGVAYVDSLWGAVAIVGLAAAAHQGFSCNLFTLPSDVFPRRAVGTLIGIGGTAGAIGGMLIAKYAGFVLDRLGTFKPLFAYAGCAYLLALLVVHLLSPRLAPARVE
ncbi:MAG TPA: MFS transporter [Steroidobacteraceae bacterium]|nr:MFS transporter [Steroidobacteraceae bacterium]